MYFSLSIVLLSILCFPTALVGAVDTYHVVALDNEGKTEDLGTFDNYAESLAAMKKYPSTLEKVAVIYRNDILVNAAYALVNIKGLISVFDDDGKMYTYVHGSYGSDGAFVDYDPVYHTVQLRISGFTGWTEFQNVDIIPTSQLYNNYISINVIDLRIRTSPDTESDDNIISTATDGAIYQYYEVKKIDNLNWYRISFNGQEAWIANQVGANWVTQYSGIGLKTYYTVNNGNLLHYYRYNNNNSMTYLNLGAAPSYLAKDTIYYSFDGNYFYQDLTKMLDDYKTNTFKNSINKDPYFNYYQYLPNHTKTGYSAENFDKYIKDRGYTMAPDANTTYVNSDGSWVYGIDRSKISQMYGQGANFIESQEKYGVNALLTFATAINESGLGTSAIAFAKNNLFGHGAADSCPFSCATSYKSVKDSIMAHASMTGSGYNNPYDWRYYGSHYGNKRSGMNVKYASDPYWGEKSAANAYNRDQTYGGQDYKSNTIGIKVSDVAVPIKKDPKDSSETIYILKNNNNNQLVRNIPLTVFDKVYDEAGNGWYKVYTDVALNENQDIANTSEYSFTLSYGYVKEEYLYVDNKQPTLSISPISLEQGTTYDLLKFVKAMDEEDGDITKKVEVLHNIDITKTGTYQATFTVTDSRNFSTSKVVSIEVYKGKTPVIEASSRDVLANTAFDPMQGVRAIDPTDGDITSKIEIIENTVDIKNAGTYKITYRVENSLKLETTKTVTITVLSNAKPVIQASDITALVSTKLTFLENVGAYDLEDGDLTDQVKIVENTVNIDVPGVYKIVYAVTDKDNNTTKKEVKVTIEDMQYEKKDGDFYFYTMHYNTNTHRLDVSGSLAILGMNNTKETPIVYDFIFKNNETNVETVLPLERLFTHPTRSISDKKYSYTETWFQGSLDLTVLPKGEYTLYVRARSGKYEAKTLFNNLFLKEATKKATDQSGRGYLFRNNNYKREFPLELIIENNGLISTNESSHPANMFNSYQSISLEGGYLKVVGNSFNLGGSYSKNDTVNRYFILENKETEERLVYDVGSFVGDEVVLKTNDGFSKVRSWFNTDDKISLKTLPVGEYILYIHTQSGKVDDFGELQDLFLKANQKITLDGREYALKVNQSARYRIELTIKKT